ncbi:MAG: hypothetical protein CMJ78_01170, partial [Planctomycetaceae bacterium]|nr:hypothetical protein [Planctomycetaceae bacterium]
DGGPGFTGEGWTTAEEYSMGDSRAVKGGNISRAIREFPGNIRMCGTGHNTSLNYLLQELCYQTLLTLDSNTTEYVPQLASHWKISEDKTTFTYRINPKAHWSDGKPVVADDVVASFKLQMDPTLKDPSAQLTFGKFEPPVAKSKYIVEIKAKEQNWRNFLYFSASLPVMPAHEIGSITGEEYLDQYNYKFTAVSGAYSIANYEKDLVKDESITITRRDDFWAKDMPWYKDIYNFDRVRFLVIEDSELIYQKAKKGELDFFYVGKAEWWVKDLPTVDAVQNGWLVRQKVFNDSPNGVQGFAINMRRPPLDDVRMRKALQHLYDRKTLIEKLAYNEYVPQNSHYAGSQYENADNEQIAYDPKKAVELMAGAGWTEVGPDGIRVKDGERLSLTLTYYSPALEKYLTSFKETCKDVGVDIQLELTQGETLWKNLMERKFQMAMMAWSGLVFPNPETSLNSELADKNDNNNITGFKNARVDEICKQYDVSFDQNERRALIQEVDKIVTDEHPYVLWWYQPCQRVMYWNKFGVPEYGFRRVADYDDFYTTWWIDPDKEAKLKDARKNDQKLEVPPIEIHYWEEKAKAEKANQASLN